MSSTKYAVPIPVTETKFVTLNKKYKTCQELDFKIDYGNKTRNLDMK